MGDIISYISVCECFVALVHLNFVQCERDTPQEILLAGELKIAYIFVCALPCFFFFGLFNHVWCEILPREVLLVGNLG